METLERCISKSTVVKATLTAAKELTNDPNASTDEIAIQLREKFQVPFVAITDGKIMNSYSKTCFVLTKLLYHLLNEL